MADFKFRVCGHGICVVINDMSLLVKEALHAECSVPLIIIELLVYVWWALVHLFDFSHFCSFEGWEKLHKLQLLGSMYSIS